MCMKATPEGCELRDELKETKTAVAALDTRLTKVEGDVALMRSETQEGIRALTAKWGDTLRGIVKWTVKVILICVLAAVGLNYGASLYKMIFVN